MNNAIFVSTNIWLLIITVCINCSFHFTIVSLDESFCFYHISYVWICLLNVFQLQVPEFNPEDYHAPSPGFIGDHNSWAPDVNDTPYPLAPEIGTSGTVIDQPIEDNGQDTEIDTDSTVHDHV
jgi:hypothetical protein